MPIPGGHPEFDWHFDASNQVVEILPQLQQLLEKLAEDAAVTAPFAPGLEYVVQREHVLAASRSLLTGERVAPEVDIKNERFAFISYSSSDVQFACDLCTDLDQAGIAWFRDKRSIRTGARWVDELHAAVRRCRVFIMVVTPLALTSDWCKIEAGAAWGLDKPILAILRGVTPGELPGPLTLLQSRVVETPQQRAEFINDVRPHFADGE